MKVKHDMGDCVASYVPEREAVICREIQGNEVKEYMWNDRLTKEECWNCPYLTEAINKMMREISE